jgi:formate dehydrogenase subunit gamma
MTSHSPRLIQRYLPAQRWIHWIGVLSFFTLLVSGIALLVPPLAFLAAGGLSRLIHRIAALPFVALPVVYAILLPRATRELILESFTYTRDDWEWFKRMPAYVLGSTRGLPPQGRLNPGQRLHHASTFLMFAAVSASGVVLWLGSGRLGPQGLALAAMVHDLSMLGLSVLMIGHVYFTFLYGALPAMRTGFVTEEYARMEHRGWLESLPSEALAVPPAAGTAPGVAPDPAPPATGTPPAPPPPADRAP